MILREKNKFHIILPQNKTNVYQCKKHKHINVAEKKM